MTEIEVYYNNKKIQNNEFITPIESENTPTINIKSYPSKIYTLLMYDPDAVKGTHIHWLIININNNNINNGKIILSYKGPAPPVKSGKHRYIFELYEQDKLIDTEDINERNVSVDVVKNKLSISNYISKIQFISENINGGRKYRTKKNIKYKTNKKSRKHKINKKRLTKRKYY